MRVKNVFIILPGIIIALLLFDVFAVSGPEGSLLPPLIFWAAIGQGLIALLASIELSEGKWCGALKGYIEEYYPVLLVFPFAFLIFTRHITIYPWVEHSGSWLNPDFFIIRNFLILLLPFITAHFFIRAINNGSVRKGFLALLYLFSFVLSQSFLAFDLVMTIEYPWVNTLFGAYFFVESLYVGITFTSVIAAVFYLKNKSKFSSVLNDTVNMVMGFALLWVGLFFSQYLVIWYGNLPEEVAFIEKRLAVEPLRYIGIYTLLSLFVIPFTGFISKKIKTLIPAVILIAFIVLSGHILEKVLFLLPAVKIDKFNLIVSFLILGIPFMYTLFSQRRSIK